jgi:tryptophan-rich sensory protein
MPDSTNRYQSFLSQTMKNSLLLIACIGGVIFLGVLPSYFTMDAIQNWHAYLNKPSFNPPNYLFGPVWTLLYTLMGITLYRIIQSTDKTWKQKALLLFGIQFMFNFLWSFIFFGLHQMAWALVDIVFLLIFIVLMVFHLYKQDKVAAYLNLPYVLWVSFATVLNLTFILIN